MGRVFLPGTICDLAQRRWLSQPDPHPGQMVEMVDQIFTETVEKAESKIFWRGNPREDMEAVKTHCRTMVARLEPWLTEQVLPYDYDVEVKFKAHFEVPYICEGTRAPVVMGGGIDVVVRDDQGKFRIYDLKITENWDYVRTTLAQLTFYDLAWGIIHNDFEATSHWGLITPGLDERFVPSSVDHNDRKTLMSRIVKYAQGYWNDEWDPKSSDAGCGWCSAKGACEKFKTVSFTDEHGKQRVSFADAASRRSQFKQ
jgi:hypothetical protein